MAGRIKTGGFVYPISFSDEAVPQTSKVDHGITRRDWLAAMAMQGLITGAQANKDSMHPITALEVARSAYHVADVMLKIAEEEAAIAESLEALG